MSKPVIEYCDVWELARRRGQVSGELPLVQAERLAAVLGATDGALRFRLSGFADDRGRPAATLLLHGVVKVRCDRCGEPLDVALDERADFYFVADEAQLARLPIDDSPEEPLLGSQRFDLAALVEDQAILALPISPRHDACAAPAGAPGDVAAGGEARIRPFGALAALKQRRH